MNAPLLTEEFHLLAAAPNGVKKLRELILSLAVRGKLVAQDPKDEPASELLKRITKAGTQLLDGATRKASKPMPVMGDGEWPFALPDGWQWSRVGYLSSVVRGVSYNKSQASDTQLSGYLPLLRGHNINQRLNLDNLVFVPETLISEDQYIRSGDIVIAMSSGSAHLVGKAAQAASDLDVGFGAFCGLIRAHSEELCRYFGFFFQTPLYRNRVAGHGKGIGINNLQKGALLALECPVPPLAEQHRIVAKVDELMALCDKLDAQQTTQSAAHERLVATLLDTLTQSADVAAFADNWSRIAEHFDLLFDTPESIDKLKQTILQLAVQGKLVLQAPQEEAASEILKRIEMERTMLINEGKIKNEKPSQPISDDEVPFSLPKQWEWVRLNNLLPVFQNGASSRGDSGGVPVAVLRLADIKNGFVSLEDLRRLPIAQQDIEKYKLSDGDLLIIRVNGSVDLVGRFIPIVKAPSAIYCDHFIRMRISPKFIHLKFLSLVASSRFCRDQIGGLFVTTAGQKTVNQGHIGSLLIPLPSTAEQHRIVAKVDELMAVCDAIAARLSAARELAAKLASTVAEANLS